MPINLLHKAYILDKSDSAKEIGCLLRMESCPIYLIKSSICICRILYNRSYFSSIIIQLAKLFIYQWSNCSYFDNQTITRMNFSVNFYFLIIAFIQTLSWYVEAQLSI